MVIHFTPGKYILDEKMFGENIILEEKRVLYLHKQGVL